MTALLMLAGSSYKHESTDLHVLQLVSSLPVSHVELSDLNNEVAISRRPELVSVGVCVVMIV